MMDRQIWQRVQELFVAALDLDDAERARFLEDQCADDPALRSQVESLLQYAEETASLRPPSGTVGQVGSGADLPGTAGTPVPEIAPLEPGRRVGAYRLERILGRGGMGTVWLAHRADEAFEKKAAIKLLRERVEAGVGAQNFIRRFHRERSILARFEHPNIARLLDGGTTEDGRLYLVMEWVDGEPITDYCDREGLDIQARLRLFLEVCDAVEHAHRGLVVHRDLKPSNILVGRGGVPKLLDFGIAKLLDVEEGPNVTRTGEFFLTPRYASPEQLFGEPVTTSADVYSLGVVLRELLIGRLDPGSGSSYRDVERAITERDTRPPSAELTSTTSSLSTAAATGTQTTDQAATETSITAEQIAQQRGTAPAALRKLLRGDLDNIVLAALERDPARRYGSVQALAEDVRRHLEGLPIRARKQTVGYRLGKFLRRNPLPVASGVLVALLLVASSLVVSTQSRTVAAERDRALVAEARSRQVSDFLVDLFELSDPSRAQGTQITAREILDRGAERVREELADQPAVQSELLSAIARVYHNLALYEESEELLRAALELERSGAVGVADEERQAALLDDIGQSLLFRSDLDGAEEAGVEALRRLDALRANDPSSVDPVLYADVTNNVGLVDLERSRLDEAEARFRSAIAGWSAALGAEHPQTQVARSNLALTLSRRGAMAEAEALHREVLEVRRARLGDLHPKVAHTRVLLGSLLHDAGRYDEAAKLLRAAVATREVIYGDDHPRVGEACNNLASLLHDAGRLDEAETNYRRALEISTATYGETPHYEVAINLNNLASLLEDQGRHDEAVDLHRRSLEIRRALFGADHPAVLRSEHNLGRALVAAAARSQGRPEWEREGEELLQGAYEARRTRLGDDHLDVAASLETLAKLHRRRGETDDALELAERALAIRTESLGDEHPQVVRTKMLRAGLRCDAAADSVPGEDAAATLRALRTETDDPIAQARIDIELGLCLDRIGDAGAEQTLRRGRDVLAEAFGPAADDVERAEARSNGSDSESGGG